MRGAGPVGGGLVALVLLATGCGPQQGPATTIVDDVVVDGTTLPAPTSPAPPGATGAPRELPAPGPEPRWTAEPADCDGPQPHRVEVAGLDAALGHRYLALRLVSCSGEPIELRGVPDLALQLADDHVRELRPLVWERRPPVVVPPGGSALMGLEYLAADQEPRATGVVVELDGARSEVGGPLDLDARSRVTVYPWVADGDSIWGS